MASPGFSIRRVKLALLSACVVGLSVSVVHAQEPDEITPKVGPSSYAAVAGATVHRHAKSTNFPNQQPRREVLFGSHPAASSDDSGSGSGYGALRYPGDLTFQGGPVVGETESHAIYLLPNGCTISTCWGNPEGFLRDYGKSEMIHITDQYVGTTANHRYTVGTRAKISFTPQSTPLTDADMVAIVYAVASALGKTGYGHLYHVFLPPGTDECLTSTECYSPDKLSTFVYCAYHGSFDDTQGNHYLYSVEPYQNVGGCSVRPGTPNGQLVDSTNNVLSHETTETITDPDLDAWWNNNGNLSLNGEEIGDECEFFTIIGKNAYFDPSSVILNDKPYSIQPEYNNLRHACTTAP